MKFLRKAGYVVIAGLFLGGGMAVTAQDWRTASLEPTGVAPNPKLVREPIVQVYGARTVGAKATSACTPGSRSSRPTPQTGRSTK